MGRFPSGQREQTVNLPSLTSVVRIHPCPPPKKTYQARYVFFGLWHRADFRMKLLAIFYRIPQESCREFSLARNGNIHPCRFALADLPLCRKVFFAMHFRIALFGLWHRADFRMKFCYGYKSGCKAAHKQVEYQQN